MVVKLESYGPYSVIKFNSGTKYNLFNIKFMTDMIDTLSNLEEDRSSRYVLVQGEGNFGAGADITELKRANDDLEFARTFFNYMRQIYEKIISIQKIFIMLPENIAYGASMEMLLVSDFVISKVGTKFAAPGGKIGVFPPVLVSIGPHLIGFQNVRRLAILGEEIDADEAAKIGLVNYVSDDPMKTAKVLMDKISVMAPASIMWMKKNISWRLRESMYEAFDDLVNQVQSDTAKEGILAFISKNRPSWTTQPSRDS
ncbi:enoyl-CoA hydratase/isomerase family protein [Sulfuracidifex metallicus]|uniref:Enoyl-CoA hydratase/isomerase family protein n=1 Tax=Sulfuracidifex metallicus DSM 6482 = JCM 9184 TaxID=523847 RepID=A0A6A9QNR0_SULME|nr:enoyl-CoA hydratase/isomerase family protein [Sulfuracidifex metallicus]MUN28811.1 enoyl-CoA hydratase/isomerase family protein [Sulfuracidifex metallicus DSM 6482 = JCM 9184]